jgi:hypothetical protein
VAVVLRQVVCDLCGDSGGAQRLRSLFGVSPYGAASGNRQLGHVREIVALMYFLFPSLFCFFFSSKDFCYETLENLATGSKNKQTNKTKKQRQHREIVAAVLRQLVCDVWRLWRGTASVLPLSRLTLRRRFWQPAVQTKPLNCGADALSHSLQIAIQFFE